MHKCKLICIASIVLLTLMLQAKAAVLESIDIQEQAGKYVVKCIVNGSFQQKAFVLHQPERVVIDFKHTIAGPRVQQPYHPYQRSIISRIRNGQPNPQTLRLVFDVKQPVTLSTSTWLPATNNRHGLQINIQPTQKVGQTTVAKTPHSTIALPQARAMTSTPRHTPPHGLRDVIVVLDPGHGGKDPGAIGIKHSAEKQIVLAIARQLKQLIDRQPGMRAVLTRDGDYYVGLRQRLNIARKYNADIFVAIHADAFANHNSTGASVFALSQTGATSEAARWLAEKENYSELGGVNLSELDDRNGVIRTVLIDLSQTATISSSLQMGNHLLRHLNSLTNLHSRKVEQARFMVLKSPDIPSVLIETGFISNPREEMNLINPRYQLRLSQAIFTGLKEYFWDYPPHGTRVEAMSGINRRIARAAANASRQS